jgi:hypothetical protein
MRDLSLQLLTLNTVLSEGGAYRSYSRSDPKTTPDPNKKLFSPQHYIILIPLIRNSAFDYTNRFPFLEFKNNIWLLICKIK